jgi:hypothetical protein
MSLARAAAVQLAAVVMVMGVAGPVRAQSPDAPIDVPVRVGPLALAPVIRLTNFGHDSNVFNTEDNVKGDVTAMLSPSAEAWLRLPRAHLNARSEFDFYYFKELTSLRALDTDTAARLELPLNRLTPYVEGTLENTRHRQNLEIDAIARRRTDGVTVGADLRLTGKVTAGAYARRSRLEYKPNSLYLQTDLARVLNHTSAAEGIDLRYALTPLTTVAVNVDRARDRFEFAADRHSNSFSVSPSVEFKPFALVSGRASVGFRSRRFLTGGVPDFNGTVAFADLTYTMRERTRFAVAARRELEYSYIVGLRDYIVGDVTASVMQRFGESWDARGSLGRGRLTYRQPSTPTTPGAKAISPETVLTVGVDVGYNVARTRVGFQLEHRGRQAERGGSNRDYRRLRIGSSLTYAFK